MFFEQTAKKHRGVQKEIERDWNALNVLDSWFQLALNKDVADVLKNKKFTSKYNRCLK